MNNPIMKTRAETLPTRLEKKIRRKFLGESESGNRSADLRVLLYSHDTMGVGHMRRNLLIATQIKSQFPNASVLTIAGAKEACLFAEHANIDCLALPSFHKRADGTHTSRNLGIPGEEILELRSRCILNAVEAFQPDLLIVDKVPAGAGGELLPTLEWLSANSSCQCILGLRDILDEPQKTIRDWQALDTFDVIQTYFPTIWIYGDPAIYNAVDEYQFPNELKDRVLFTGYLTTSSRLEGLDCSASDNEPFVLCTIGGGQDGEALPTCFIEAIRETKLPAKILTGPYMSAANRETLKQAATDLPWLEVIDFAVEGDILIKQASRIVSMGGYNTLAAILTHQKRALVVPRIEPREEQLIRANRLAELGYVDTLHPDQLSASAIAAWLNSDDSPVLPAKQFDMAGLQRICDSIGSMLPNSKRCTNKLESHA